MASSPGGMTTRWRFEGGSGLNVLPRVVSWRKNLETSEVIAQTRQGSDVVWAPRAASSLVGTEVTAELPSLPKQRATEPLLSRRLWRFESRPLGEAELSLEM